MKRPKFTRSARPAMFDPEAPESFVNGAEQGSGFDDVCETFLGRDYNDGDAAAVTDWLKSQEMAMA